MVSTCPQCISQVTHPDSSFEVSCQDCGAKFNPFLPNGGGDEAAGGAMAVVNENGNTNVGRNGPTLLSDGALGELPGTINLGGDLGGNLGNFGAPAAASAGGGFQESSAVFQDIVEYGESLAPAGTPPAKTAPTPKLQAQAAPKPMPVVTTSTGEGLMTAGETLQGYAIGAYLPPISVVAEVNLSGGDPLRTAFDSLWAQAAANGASGVLTMRWQLTPDGAKVILSGTPVRCNKQ